MGLETLADTSGSGGSLAAGVYELKQNPSSALELAHFGKLTEVHMRSLPK